MSCPSLKMRLILSYPSMVNLPPGIFMITYKGLNDLPNNLFTKVNTTYSLKLLSYGGQRSASFVLMWILEFHHVDNISGRIIGSFIFLFLSFLGKVEQICELVGFGTIGVFLTLNIHTTLTMAVHWVLYIHNSRHWCQQIYLGQ